MNFFIYNIKGMVKKKIQPTEQARKAIQKARPDLKQISLETYIVSLRSLYKRLHPDDALSDPLTSEFLRNKDKVMDDLKDRKITTKKNILTSILVFLSSDKDKDEKLNDFYQLKLKDLNKNYNEFLDKQERTDTQAKNWITKDQFVEITNDLLEEVKKANITKKEKLSRGEYVLLQKFVLLSLYQKFHFRNNFATMKILTQKEYDDIKDEEKKENNYFVKDGKQFKIYLNQFKNVKRLGPKTFEVDEKLAKILRLFLKHNKSGYLLTLSNGRDPLNGNGITKALNSIFKKAVGKSIGSSLLRHINISADMEGEETIQEKKEAEKKIEDTYMHSASMSERYRKIK